MIIILHSLGPNECGEGLGPRLPWDETRWSKLTATAVSILNLGELIGQKGGLPCAQTKNKSPEWNVRHERELNLPKIKNKTIPKIITSAFARVPAMEA